MIIGLTYDLREDYRALGLSEEDTAEFDSPRTVEAIEHELRQLGHQTERIGGIQPLTRALADGRRWDLVFNISEGLYGRAREAQVPALLDAYRIPYTFSDPLVCALTLDKGLTKRVMRDAGVPTPPFVVVSDERGLAAVDLHFPLFIKPVAEGSGKGIGPRSRVDDRSALEEIVRDIWQRFRQPALVERFLPGREFTVGIVGTGSNARSVGVLEVKFNFTGPEATYGYDVKQDWEDKLVYHLVDGPVSEEAVSVALAAWRVLGCRDAGRLDLKVGDDGRIQFLEVNPLAGLNPETSDLPILCRLGGIGYHTLIADIVRSAQDRSGVI